MIPPDSNPNPQAKADGGILMMGRAQISNHPDKSDHIWKIVDNYGNKYCIVCLIYVDPDEEWDYGYYNGPGLSPALNPPNRATIGTKPPPTPRPAGPPMNSKRKGRPVRPHIPVTKISSEEASEFQRDVNSAPVLEPPDIRTETEQGLILDVKKVGFLGNDPSVIYTGYGLAYLQTTDGEYYRLPAELGPWARDVITGVLAAGGRESGIFPTRIGFGRLNGRAYAEML